MQARPSITEVGRRNFERLVSLTAADCEDSRARKQIADALAALLSEVTPVHREVIASTMTRNGYATGRIKTWLLPPGLHTDVNAQRKWAAMVFLDSVDAISDQLDKEHNLAERVSWRERAYLYTQGAEHLPVSC